MALFGVLLEVLAAWIAAALVILGLVLVMSSADTLLSGIASIVAVDLCRAMPGARAGFLLAASRISTLLLAVPLLFLASKGYSVLYLILIADLVCAAAAFPVFYGLYCERYTGRAAMLGNPRGPGGRGLLFPDSAMTRGSLFWSFVVAVVVSVIVSLVLSPRRHTFDLKSLQGLVREMRD